MNSKYSSNKSINEDIYKINPIEDYEKNGYETYYLKAQCDDSVYCNHGIDIHISIRSKSNEILFFYNNW